MNIFLVLITLFSYNVLRINATLSDCMKDCLSVHASYQQGCTYHCYHKFSFGGTNMATKKDCYDVCLTVPTSYRTDCKKGCDFAFRDDPLKNILKYGSHTRKTKNLARAWKKI